MFGRTPDNPNIADGCQNGKHQNPKSSDKIVGFRHIGEIAQALVQKIQNGSGK